MSKAIIIDNCLQCPFYKEENNEIRHGEVGYVSFCKSLEKEIAFTDKMDTPYIYEKTHKECPLISI